MFSSQHVLTSLTTDALKSDLLWVMFVAFFFFLTFLFFLYSSLFFFFSPSSLSPFYSSLFFPFPTFKKLCLQYLIHYVPIRVSRIVWWLGSRLAKFISQNKFEIINLYISNPLYCFSKNYAFQCPYFPIIFSPDSMKEGMKTGGEEEININWVFIKSYSRWYFIYLILYNVVFKIAFKLN